MAKVRITYARRAPFSAVELPGTDPSVRLTRGESVVVDEAVARALARTLGTPALPDLAKEHFAIDPVDEDDPDAAGELPEDLPGRALLIAGGYGSRGAVEAASDEDLLGVDGVGEGTLKKIRAYAWK